MPDEPAASAPPVAAELVHKVFVLLKAAGVYDKSNEGFRRHSDAARETLARALEEHGKVHLEARGELLFFNGLRVRFPVDASAGGRYLIAELGKRGVGAVEFARAEAAAQLDALAFALRGTDPRRGEGLPRVRELLAAAEADAVAVHPRAAAEGGEAARAEDGRAAAQKAFFRAVRLVEEVMTRAREGREAAFAPAKRVVQTLAERVVDDEQTLFELATLRTFDEYTFAHCVNVCVYSISIGTRLGLDRAQLTDLGLAALFHDLGKAKLPLALIDKPDEYDEAEWEQMHRHPALGAKTLLAMRRTLDRGLARAVRVAYEHHRGVDGSGYPRPRRKARQDLFARICAIADSFDAMTSGRVYQRRAMGPAEALRRMLQRSGTGYDPVLLRLFVGAVGVFPIGTPVLLDDGRAGVVWRNDAADLMRPRVRVPVGPKGGEGAAVVDLARRDPATGEPLASVRRICSEERLGVGIQSLLNAVDAVRKDKPAA
ncbi:MAG: HD-GYP domain-containing protein [Elusimicrobia bacterium]|nr:HD-GYP domain-containing protein [Elusimicrobiota bacterium]